MKLCGKLTLCGLLGALLFAAFLFAADSGQDLFQKGLAKERAEADPRGAIKLYERVVKEHASDRKLAAQALYRIGECQQALGSAEGRKAFERVVKEFSDQTEIVAQARLAVLSTGSSAAGAVHVRRLFSGSDFFNQRVYPSWDGRFIANGREASGREGEGELRVYDLQSGQSRHALYVPINYTGPTCVVCTGFGDSVVSPDGKRILYEIWSLPNAEDSQIRIVNIDGSQDRLLFKDPKYGGSFKWFADGRQVVAILRRKDGKNDIQIISIADGSLRVVFTGDREMHSQVWPSPDGQYIGFEYYDEVYVVSVSGGEAVAAVRHPATGSFAGWSPDGRVVFLSDRTGTNDLWAQRLQNGRPTGTPEPVRTNLPSNIYDLLGMTREGAFIYATGTPVQELYTGEIAAVGLLAGGPNTISGRFIGQNTAPDYSPDGQYLAYVSGPNDSSSAAIRIRTLATGEERTIPKPARQTSRLRWYPDGKSILALGSDPGGKPGFYRLDAQTGAKASVPLEGTVSNVGDPSFSPDGKYLYYRARPDLKNTRLQVVMKMEVATGASQEIFRPNGLDLRNYALSPDGFKILFDVSKGAAPSGFQYGLYVAPLTGGEPKLLQETLPNQEAGGPWYGALAWTADGKAAIYIQHVDGFALMRIPIDGGQPVKLASTGSTQRIAIHPDGRRITWETVSAPSETWVMENLFPGARETK